MCHSMSGALSDLATSIASRVLPVPGSPLTRSGRSSAIAALTAILRPSVATYALVPSKRILVSFIRPRLVKRDRLSTVDLTSQDAGPDSMSLRGAPLGNFCPQAGTAGAGGRPRPNRRKDAGMGLAGRLLHA